MIARLRLAAWTTAAQRNLRGRRGVVAVSVWAALVVAGLTALVRYSTAPGEPGAAPKVAPAGLPFELGHGRSSLVLFAHPHCPCTRASLTELGDILARSDRLDAVVAFYRPVPAPAGWDDSDTWEAAARLPRTRRLWDDDGALAGRLGAKTSGQVVLYDETGALAFQGGITPSRGHLGDSVGVRAILAHASGDTRPPATAAVFGCPLDDPSTRTEAAR